MTDEIRQPRTFIEAFLANDPDLVEIARREFEEKIMTEKWEDGDKRVKVVHDLVPKDWDNSPLSLAHELRQFLKSIVDEGTSIDSGGGDGFADLHPVIGGIEYTIQIEPTKRLLDRLNARG